MSDVCGAPVADANNYPIPCTNTLPCTDHPHQIVRYPVKEFIYQLRVVRRLEKEFPGCFVIKNDPRFIQGLPDLLILFNDTWAMLEVKASEDSPPRPNQPYYVETFGQMSYASFIFPENEERVFDELQLALCNRRSTRVS